MSHGSPLFLPGHEDRRAALHRWGASLAQPRAIVVMTPHVASRRLAIGSTGHGFAMYDLPGVFKRQLPADLDYPTPPSVELAAHVDPLLGDNGLLVRVDRRGFDHTTWMPLLCLFPAASAPVLELAYPYLPDGDLLALGRRLAPLRAEGVMFIASGGMTHNLATLGAGSSLATPSWAREFDGWAAEKISHLDVDALVDWRHKAPAANLAHPDDGAHFRVLLVALGVLLGAQPGSQGQVAFPMEGFESSLSGRCVELG